MIKRFIAMVVLILPCLVWGQSSLPPCPAGGYKHNCFGYFTFPNGGKYVGEWSNNKFDGEGIAYRADGSINQSGRWYGDTFGRSYPLDPYRFPFNNPLEVAATSSVSQSSVQSSLPQCQGDFLSAYWDRCFGTAIYADGARYTGEFLENARHGLGILYRGDGSTNRSGRWIKGFLDQGIGLDTKSYPFSPTTQQTVGSSQVTGQDKTKAEAERLAPPCPETGFKHNCYGTITFSNGDKYVGEFRNNKINGQGIEYRVDGSMLRSGRWVGYDLVQSLALDTNRFPFNPPVQLATTPTVDPGKAERDRLAAEVEAERKKREELERKLAEAEAKERERQQVQTPLPQQPQAAIRNERRVALLVGNGGYKQSPLTNSVNDAVDLNASLKNLGFQTLLVQNASLATMRQKTREFAELALNADVALIFFSGHGIEYRGNNYLIPTSAGSLKEFEVEDETFNVARWMDMLETQKGANKQRVNIVILDACRDNAFSRGWRNTNRGLARMDAPSGTILAYATAPGKLASDGSAGERNSPYTKNLLRAIQQPNVPVEQVFKDVRRMVVEQTRGEQVPWENSSLIGNFVFKR